MSVNRKEIISLIENEDEVYLKSSMRSEFQKVNAAKAINEIQERGCFVEHFYQKDGFYWIERIVSADLYC